MEKITQLRSGTWLISLPFQGEHQVIGCYVLKGTSECALIDPGPASTAQALLESLQSLGIAPGEVQHILLTHIHLDHAGALGTLLPLMPEAQAWIHAKGAPHMIRPAKFLASAARFFGDRMYELWGDVIPVLRERVQIIVGGEVLDIVGRHLEVHSTPGHTSHHVVFFDTSSGELFAGDAAGMRLPGSTHVRPPTTPPDVDLEAMSKSIEVMKQLSPNLLYLAHFGPCDEPLLHLERLGEQIAVWGNIVLCALQEGKNEQEIVETLIEQTRPGLQHEIGDANDLKRYNLVGDYRMLAQGYIHYWRTVLTPEPAPK